MQRINTEHMTRTLARGLPRSGNIIATIRSTLTIGTLALLGVPGVAYSATCVVGADKASVSAAALDASCTTIQVPAGTWTATDVKLTTAGTVLEGAGQGVTVIDGAGTAALWIDADNVTIRNLTIKDGSQGVRFDKSGTTISGALLEDITISDNTSYGVTLHNLTTVDGLTVRRATIARNSTGIRVATTGIGKNLTIESSVFSGQTAGPDFYQANDGGTGYVDGLTVKDSSFTGNVAAQIAAVYGEELQNVLVENNTFTGPYRGFYLYNVYSGAAQPAGNVTVRGNTFTDHRYAAVIVISSQKLDLPVTIENNTMNQDISVIDPAWGHVIDLRLKSGFAHAPVTITGNQVTLARSGITGPVTAYGIRVRGDYNGVTISGNTLNGSGVSGPGSATTPRGAGIYVASNFSGFGAPSAASTLMIDHNVISGFTDGVSVWDATTNTYGGLPTGNAMQVNRNSLVGNSGFGIHNGPASMDGKCNWWGADGPIEGTNVSGDVDTSSWLLSSDLDGACIGGASTCTGFFHPVDMNGVVNLAKAGSGIPLKWRCLDGATPVSDPARIELVAGAYSCGSGPAAQDSIEEYTTGSSGLQYKGDGYWQFNWKTLKSYANQCSDVVLKVDGVTKLTAKFKFRK